MRWIFFFAALFFVTTAVARENIPDPALTPGEVATTDLRLVCERGYSRERRHTTQKMKRDTYRAYGIENTLHFKIDHLVPLSLGGADSMKNIWPTDFTTPDHTAADKDRFEIKARHLACIGQLTVEQAQQIFMTDWRKGYDQYCKKREDCPNFREIKAKGLPFP